MTGHALDTAFPTRSPSGEGEASAASPPSPRLRSSGLWVAVDQGLFGLSNLLLNLVLASILTPAAYGAFSGAFAALLLLGGLHTALFTEPMLVHGARRGPGGSTLGTSFGRYLRLLLSGHVGFSAAAAALLGAAGLLLGAGSPTEPGAALLAAAAAQPFVLALWLLRRASYASFVPRIAAAAGAAQLLLVLSGLGLLALARALTPASAFLLMGVASAATAVGLGAALGVPLRAPGEPALRRRVAHAHWRFGRWALAASPFEWLPGHYYYWALPYAAGLAAAGTLRAMMNLVQPMVQLHAGLRLLLIPALVDAAGRPWQGARLRKAVLGMTLPALAYWAALVALGPPVVARLYGEAYGDPRALLALLGAIPVLTGLSGVAGSLVRARQRPDHELRSYALASLAGLAFGLPLLLRYGVLGAAAGYVASYGVLVAAKTFFALRVLREPPASGGSHRG